MERYILKEMLAWRSSPHRKPLLLWGARQVGKTYILQKFGRQFFDKVHYFNFERTPELHSIFAHNLEPNTIITQLEFYLGLPIDRERDLIIFDEIQECPNALTSLKYFCEDMPKLALCAAGSLLGLQFSSHSFPVGKVDILHLHPLCFEEFLLGLGDNKSLDILHQLSHNSFIPEIVHKHLWEKLKLYFIVGGLPEVITTYLQYQTHLLVALEKVRKKQEELITAYTADMAKHAGKVNAMHIDRVWRAVPEQLALAQDGSAQKFKFKGVIPGINRYDRMAGPIDWLQSAGLIIKIPIANAAQLPLAAYTKENAFKLYMFDVGILGAMSYLSPKAILDYHYGTYKGYFAENFVAQEFRSKDAQPLYCWQARQSEVEFVRVVDDVVIPIEVKSGHVTQAKSIKIFQEKYQAPYRVIMSANNLRIDHQHKLHRYPLYLAYKFPLL